MESAWTLNETCRFRIQTPEQYDASSENQGDQKALVNCKLYSIWGFCIIEALRLLFFLISGLAKNAVDFFLLKIRL